MPDIPAAHAVHQRAAAAVARQRAVALPQPGGRPPPAPWPDSPNAHALLIVVLDALLQENTDAQGTKTIWASRGKAKSISSFLSSACTIILRRPNQAVMSPCSPVVAHKHLTSMLLAGSKCEVSGRDAAEACGGDPLTDWLGEPLDDAVGVPDMGAAWPAFQQSSHKFLIFSVHKGCQVL